MLEQNFLINLDQEKDRLISGNEMGVNPIAECKSNKPLQNWRLAFSPIFGLPKNIAFPILRLMQRSLARERGVAGRGCRVLCIRVATSCRFFRGFLCRRTSSRRPQPGCISEVFRGTGCWLTNRVPVANLA